MMLRYQKEIELKAFVTVIDLEHFTEVSKTQLSFNRNNSGKIYFEPI